MQVAIVARDEAKLHSLIESEGCSSVHPYVADVSNSDDVLRVFDSVDSNLGEPDVVVFNAGAFQKNNVLDIDPADFERCWRIGCLGGLLVGKRQQGAWSSVGMERSFSLVQLLHCAVALASPA